MIDIAGTCQAPRIQVQLAALRYLRSWADEDEKPLAAWRKTGATFCRLPEGDWGVAVPVSTEPIDCSGEYEVTVRRKDGSMQAKRVRPAFTVVRFAATIEVCEIVA